MGSPDIVVDTALESEFLGSCIIYPDQIAGSGVAVRDFFRPCNQIVFRVLLAMVETGEPICSSTVRAALIVRGDLKSVGDEYLIELTSGVPLPNFPTEALKRLAAQRRLQDAALALIGSIGKPAQARLLEDMDRAREDLAMLGTSNVTIMTASQMMESSVEDYTSQRARVHLGLPRLSAAVGQPPLGCLVVVAADTGVGKSTFCLEMLLACAKSPIPIYGGMISLEDPPQLTGGRLLQIESGVSSRLLQRNLVEDKGWEAVSRAVVSGQLLGNRLQFGHCVGATERTVISYMEAMAKGGAKVIVVDYLTAIRGSVSRPDRRNEMNHVLVELKAAAVRLGVVLVLVSQLSRPPKNVRWKPSKHDLKETGDLENMAEVIVLLWRDEESDFAPVNVQLAKVKWGGTGQMWTMRRDKTEDIDGHGSARLLEEDYAPRLTLVKGGTYASSCSGDD